MTPSISRRQERPKPLPASIADGSRLPLVSVSDKFNVVTFGPVRANAPGHQVPVYFDNNAHLGEPSFVVATP